MWLISDILQRKDRSGNATGTVSYKSLTCAENF